AQEPAQPFDRLRNRARGCTEEFRLRREYAACELRVVYTSSMRNSCLRTLLKSSTYSITHLTRAKPPFLCAPPCSPCRFLSLSKGCASHLHLTGNFTRLPAFKRFSQRKKS